MLACRWLFRDSRGILRNFRSLPIVTGFPIPFLLYMGKHWFFFSLLPHLLTLQQLQQAVYLAVFFF